MEFLEGWGSHLYPLVLTSYHVNYDDAINKAIRLEARFQRDGQEKTLQIPSGGPQLPIGTSSYVSQQPFQQQQFFQKQKPHRFKLKERILRKLVIPVHIAPVGPKVHMNAFFRSSVSSSTVYCESCGDRNPTAQCGGVQGLCHSYC